MYSISQHKWNLQLNLDKFEVKQRSNPKSSKSLQDYHLRLILLKQNTFKTAAADF